MKIPKNSYAKIKRLFEDGFTISELRIMYNTTNWQIEQVLDED